MKKTLLILLAFIGLCSTQIYAQDETFDNGSPTDNFWSNTDNWINGVLPTGRASISYSVDLNGNQTAQKIRAFSVSANPIIVNGGLGDVLTLGTGWAVNNAINNEFHLDTDINIIANSTFRNKNNANSRLIFSQGRTITLGSNDVDIRNQTAANPIEFHGSLSGTSSSIFTMTGASTNNSNGGITFSSTADNTDYAGIIRSVGNEIVSDIVAPQLFVPSNGRLQFSELGGTVTLNGENTMKGQILRTNWTGGIGAGTVVFNANQDNMERLAIWGSSGVGDEMLTFDINANVDNLWFVLSNFVAGSTFNIIGFQDGVLGFGDNVSQTVLDTWLLNGVEPADGTLFQDSDGYITTSATWEGATSTEWTTVTNWKDNVAPGLTASIGVSIPAGATNYPIITAAQTLTINSGVSLTVDPGAMITNNGTITNNGDLILVSNAAGTGYLVSINKSVANVTQQRYSSSPQRGWRLLSNPVTSLPFGDFAANSTTPFTLGDNASGAYDPGSNTWLSYNDSNYMLEKGGYKIFIRGIAGEGDGLDYSTSGGPSNVTMSIKGTAANAAPGIINVTAGNWYLIANPYTAPVSLAAIIGVNDDLSNTVSYYNPTIASNGTTDLRLKKGGYDADVIPIPTTVGSVDDVILPPMGAIFVEASSNGIMSVPTSAIYTGSVLNPYVYNHKGAKESKTTDDDVVKLTMEVVSNGVYYDKLALQFKEEGTEGSNIDFGKMYNTILDFFHLTEDNVEMAVSELELKEQIIPLGIYSYAFQNFTIHIKENSIPSAYEAVLKDALLDTSTVLATGVDYSFDLTSASETQGYERFSIVLKTSGSLSVEEDVLSANINVYPNPAKEQFNLVNNGTNGETSFEIYSVTGQLVHAIKAQSNTTTTVNVTDWAAGIYILKAMNNETSTTKKLIIQ